MKRAGDPSASAVLRPALIDKLDDEAIGIGAGADDSFVIIFEQALRFPQAD